VIIEESMLIHAPVKRVWDVFVTFTCWADWNRVLTDVNAHNVCLAEGKGFRCCIRPYFFPVNFSPHVTLVETHKKIIWTATKYGISSEHEFLFEEIPDGMNIVSRETFSGFPILLGAGFFIKNQVRQLTISFLDGLRIAAEA